LANKKTRKNEQDMPKTNNFQHFKNLKQIYIFIIIN